MTIKTHGSGSIASVTAFDDMGCFRCGEMPAFAFVGELTVSLLKWLRRLFIKDRRKISVESPHRQNVSPSDHQTQNAQAEGTETGYDGKTIPKGTGHLNNLDGPMRDSLAERERKILNSVQKKIQAGKYELPNLPSTSAMILDMSSNPSISLVEVAKTIENDPVLSSELLKAANSVFYGGTQSADTLHQGVVRLGLRNLRALTLALSMKSVISKSRGMVAYAEEIWRQAISVAKIARQLAGVAHEDQDKAFLMGLLHNIGKVPLIDMVAKSVSSGTQISRALLGNVFNRFHEEVGAAMAEKWNLPEEVASVAGCHHDFENNENYPRSAALVSLAQKMDLYLCLESSKEYWWLINEKEVELLRIPPADRNKVFQECLDAFVEGAEEKQAVPV